MKSKKIQINQNIDEIISVVVRNLNLEIISITDNLYRIKKPADWFTWGSKITLKVETLKGGFIVFEVISTSLLGDFFNQESDLEKEIISELLNKIKK